LKKIIKSSFTLFLLFSLLAACTNESSLNQQKQKNKPEIVDLGGSEFIFPDYSGYFRPAESLDNTLIEDSKIANFKRTEERLNVKITIKPVEWSIYDNQLVANASIGEIEDDFFMTGGDFAYRLYRAGLLVPLNDIKAIDLTDEEKWGNQKRRACMTFDGKLYASPWVGSAYWPQLNSHGYRGQIVCNNNLIDYLNAIHPRELIEQGHWTFDGFKDYLPTISEINAENPK
jgi:ABC-type glycerol-3-phosphate transport system substrate-binding protein